MLIIDDVHSTLKYKMFHQSVTSWVYGPIIWLAVKRFQQRIKVRIWPDSLEFRRERSFDELN